MSGKLFPRITEIKDLAVAETLSDMAEILEMVLGTAGGLSTKPGTPYEGQLERFIAGVAGVTAGLYEYRSGSWNKL